jgi:hypothetical protein
LTAELSKLTEFVIQIYKTLKYALQDRYLHCRKSNRPIFPLVVTLEEWYVFGHKLDAEIDSRVRIAFGENGIDETLLARYPYTICSEAFPTEYRATRVEMFPDALAAITGE